MMELHTSAMPARTGMTSAFFWITRKNKMTEDIGKFLKKEAELMKIMGDIRVGIWNFVLPFWNNKDLLKHARKKQDEVRKKKPKHIKADFRISVITADEFAVEAETQRGCPGESGESTEPADHRYHYGARQHVGSDIPRTRGGSSRHRDHGSFVGQGLRRCSRDPRYRGDGP